MSEEIKYIMGYGEKSIPCPRCGEPTEFADVMDTEQEGECLVNKVYHACYMCEASILIFQYYTPEKYYVDSVQPYE